eukprot:190187_1
MGSTESCECLPFDMKQKKEENAGDPAPVANKEKHKNQIRTGVATVYLLTTIISNYFNDDSNKCEFIRSCDETKDNIAILDHIILYGGSVRDLVLDKSILRDIDITINTRELTKLQLIHLQKYHNTLQ